MITDQQEIVATVIVAAVRSATSALVADLRLVQAQINSWEARWSDLGALRERLAVVEDRAKAKQSPLWAQMIDLDPVLARLALLEQREPMPGPAGRDGVNGKDAVVDVDAIIDAVSARIPVPKDGRDGKDAAPADVDEIVRRAAALIPTPEDGKDAPPVDVEDLARRAAALIPVPKDGAKGDPGKDAPAVDLDEVVRRAAALIPVPKDGVNGKDAQPVDLDDLVLRAAALVPVPKDGKDGKDAPVVDVEDLARRAALLIPAPRDGQPGVPGRDGKDADPELLRREVAAAVAALPAPKDGQPGRDGTLEALRIEVADDRTIRFVHRSDGTLIEGGLVTFPVVLDRGVYKPERSYEKGDGVTFGGSFWIAQGATKERPGDGATAWRLAVKRGQDGANGKPGDRGGPGPKGDKGDPGRNFS